jgi:salicylate hydroxylase
MVAPALARAALPIHAVVVGGSLAGLATALALARIGHAVTVLEQLGEDAAAALPSGGLRLMPNATRILERWGLGPQLAAIAEDSRIVRIYTYVEGEYMGTNEWHEALLRECGGQTLNVGYAALRTLLLGAARAAGAAVRFGARVVAIDDARARVTLESGEVVEADIVVGADGARGVTRAALFEGAEEVGPSEMVVFKCVRCAECSARS